MDKINILAHKFRNAIDSAISSGEFQEDFSFSHFPRGCCGDASDLLAQFLLENGIITHYVCGTYRNDSFEGMQSHAWLLTNNKTIIDITGDQFKYNPVFLKYDKSIYVGIEDDFHRLFKVEDRDIYQNFGLDSLGNMCRPRLKKLYTIIIKYL